MDAISLSECPQNLTAAIRGNRAQAVSQILLFDPHFRVFETARLTAVDEPAGSQFYFLE